MGRKNSYKLYGIIGFPIKHSLSPYMHNAAFNRLKLKAAYLPFSVNRNRLKEAIGSLRDSGISGFNVTIPYKQVILSYCDELSSEVKEICAANTVLNKNGKLIAYNTDVDGFEYGLKNLLPDQFSINETLIIGAGGAARAVVHVLSKMGCKKFYLADLDPEREKQWLHDPETVVTNKWIKFIHPQNDMLAAVLTEVNLIIQATPVGTFPKIDETIQFPFQHLTSQHYLYDLVYNPIETKFARLAKQAGSEAANGLDMLAAQAVKSLFHWGYKPDRKDNVAM